MVEHVGCVNADLETLDEAPFAKLERLARGCIQIPGSRQQPGVLSEIAACSRFRVLENDLAGGAVGVADRKSVECATAVVQQIETHRVGVIRSLTLRIRYDDKRTRIAEEGSAMGVAGCV